LQHAVSCSTPSVSIAIETTLFAGSSLLNDEWLLHPGAKLLSGQGIISKLAFRDLDVDLKRRLYGCNAVGVHQKTSTESRFLTQKHDLDHSADFRLPVTSI
jgi:hypothetical protein